MKQCNGAIEGRKVRIAMIGAGVMANRVHYPSLASFDDVEIVGICDIDNVRLKKTADKYGVKNRYGSSVIDYQRMIKDLQPDAVYVIGQPHIMYDIWQWCLKQGVNLYIEKPLGLTIHQARSLAYLAEENGCITQVSFQRRICPMVVDLRNECLKKGPINYAVVRYTKGRLIPYLDARCHIMDDCIHAFDFLRWACGGEAINITSHVKRVGVPDINYVSADIEFDNGAIGCLTYSWASARRAFKVEMHSAGICAEAEHEGKGYLYTDGDTNGVLYDTQEFSGSKELFVYAGFQGKNREFIDCIKAGKQPESNFSDAVKSMEIAEVVLAQALLDGK